MKSPVLLTTLFLGSAITTLGIGTTYTDLSSFNAASGAVLHETFETAVPKNTPLSSLTLNDITYQGATPAHNVFVASPGYNNFGAGVGTTTSSVLTANGAENFVGAVLSGSPNAVGMDVYLNGRGPATLAFYNGDTLLDSITWVTGDSIVFGGLVSPVPITSFHFFSTGGEIRNTGVDNIRLAVPDAGPGIAAAVLPALLAAGQLMRRKR